ncbi:tRNA (adenosine(37)-N6)-threonylcarbamoyltransferase complex ATPase subunit type 1 TsaE [Capnocytophaga canimorsus]|nr:tRNA (adenosine(37)-N6)-threonylcarbamoyltransferase complex ATPase subunit type 1 TsaE [Capnocytophaga canimorsus]ATA77958.1 tRNA (adenosine(37)-N6)-threonylcarbamoyltransferase complex ATPase subunit type 1 TsaE [Capnocytophaga canimorsus]PJI80257.1 tRNA threonylcarbamoyladenosine biosynthesis protein TsaE [Capnocytophaga canimorsus]STA73264.1 ADP-binding protein [Capnocytophaga canimorsus]
MQTITYTLENIEETAKRLLPLLSEKVVVFEGSMGMGKTTLIKALVATLGITDTVGSPTYGLVNEYANTQHTVYHFDFYRITSEEEAFDMGIEEYLYSGNWCFIEWAERIPSYLPQTYTKLIIEKTDALTRTIKILHISNL